MQHVYKYAAKAKALAKETVGDLTDKQVTSLQSELSEMGLLAWRQWRESHSQDIYEYMAATPSQRQKKKSWQYKQAKLAFAAYWDYQFASQFLSALDDPGLQPGGSYRQVAADAAQVYQTLRKNSLDAWPFSLPYPFVD